MIRAGVRGRLSMSVFVAAVAALHGPATRGDDARPWVIRAAKVYVSPDKVLSPGAVMVRDGRLERVAERIPVADDVRVVDMENATITAGLIEANTTAGYHSGFLPAEQASECVPEMRVLDTIDLNDPALLRLAREGVTTVYVSPDSSSVIGARGAIVHTAGAAETRVIREAAAVKASIGQEPIYKAVQNRTPSRFGVSHLTRRPTTRMGLVWVLRKSFYDARAVQKGATPPTRGEGSPSDASLPYLIDILEGDLPFRIQARSQIDILTAIRLSREFDFTFVLEEGTDAHRCIDELRATGVRLIYGPLFDTPTGFRGLTDEVHRFRYSAPRTLMDGGIRFALSAAELEGEAALPMQAGYAMRLGLTREEALAAVTTIPADILGISDVAGTLESGGDFVVWSGEPFEATTRAEMVFIGGKLVSDRTTKAE